MLNNNINVLFIGDIVGRPGRNAIYLKLPVLEEKYKLDFVIANGENAAGGIGLTPKIADELFKNGIELITSGNHIWAKKEILPYLDQTNRVLRPANYPPNVPGKGWTTIILHEKIKIGIINLQGRIFMHNLDCPFRVIEDILKKIKPITPIILVDFHAEATSEKMAMGWFLDGQASAILGTHTHVQTADETILPKGSAYITDVGMSGPLHSVIGMEKQRALRGLITQLPQRFKPEKGLLTLQAVILAIDIRSGKAQMIKRIRETINEN
jgi:hypothetical protein